MSCNLFTDFETIVLDRLNEIFITLNRMAVILENVEKKQEHTAIFMMDKRIVHQSKVDFAKKYKLQLPITNIDVFQKFNASLSEDQYLKSDVVSILV